MQTQFFPWLLAEEALAALIEPIAEAYPQSSPRFFSGQPYRPGYTYRPDRKRRRHGDGALATEVSPSNALRICVVSAIWVILQWVALALYFYFLLGSGASSYPQSCST